MSARQTELREVVIIRRDGPFGRKVALLAVLRETASDVIGIVRALVVRHMTRGALRRKSVILAARVALQTLCFNMRTRQREIREIVIKVGVVPVTRIVADFAICPETCLSVRGTLCAVVIGLVTRDARTFRSSEDSTVVALSAVCEHVRTRQRECRLVVIETRTFPRIRGVTLGARRGILSGMRRIFGLVVILLVTCQTFAGRFFICRLRVTFYARRADMRSGQREAC